MSDLKIALYVWYDVTYQSDTSYRSLLYEGGFSRQQTESQYRSRPNDEVIAEFEALLEKRLPISFKTMEGLTILAMDQMSLYFQATLSRVWAPKGQTSVVKVSPQREHVHFYGALNLMDGREVALTAPEQTASVTADFLRLLLMLFPAQHLLILLDRATWHFGPEIAQLLAENPHLELWYFPPACPDLNPQEHVWEQARDAISHNHSYRSFQSLVDAFETFLNETPFETNFLDKYAPPILCQL